MGKEIKPDISTPSPDLVRIVLLLPQTNIHSPFYFFFSPLPHCFVFRALAAAVQELPFIRRSVHARLNGDASDQMHICSTQLFFFLISFSPFAEVGNFALLALSLHSLHIPVKG